MSKSAEHAQTPANSAVRNTAGKILPIMAEKVHQEKLKGVQTRLSYSKNSRQKAQTKEKMQHSESESCDRKRKTKKRRSPILDNVLRNTRPGRSPSVFSRLRWKSKKNGTRLTKQTAGDTLKLKMHASLKASMMTGGAGDNYEMLWKTFLGNFSQQKKYIKDPVEIHHIKQREGESTVAFIERFKAKGMHVNRAPECMRISGFMHDITNLDLIKKLNDNIPKFVDEMMSVTTAFLQGEVVVANQSRKKASLAWRHHETNHKTNFNKRPNFKNRHKSGRKQDRFTPLTKTPKEILTMETVKFKAPPPMSGLIESQNKNKFCEFHGEKGHIMDECIHLQK
ncbi:hypothetical protein Tco_0863197 [Tanacetum coccineum]